MSSVQKDFAQKIPSRISITLLCGLLVTEIYVTRSSLSIAIVSMVQTVTKVMVYSDVKREPFCLRDVNNVTNQYLKNVITNITEEKPENNDLPPIQMSSTERGNLLSAFFYAYGISGIIGGRLAEIYGTKKVCSVALLVDAVANILTPVVSQSSYWLFFTLRCFTGFCQGMCYPAFTFLLSQWIPPDELTRVIGFVYMASSFGTVFSMTFGGYIISLLGWEYVFYFSGAFSLLCLTLWIFFIFDTPEKHPRISLREKLYVTQNLKGRRFKKPKNIPWVQMLQSLPLWAANVAHAGTICGVNLLVTQLPIFMSSIIGVNIRKNGVLSALPFVGRFVVSNASSWLLHFIMNKCHWELKTTRRVATIISLAGPGVSFLLVGYIGCDHWPVTSLFILGAALNGFCSSGYHCTAIDITSNFSGTAKGIENSFAFMVSMMVPVVIGALTPEETISEWRTVFWLLFAINVGAALFFNIFVSTEIQSWDHKKEDDEDTEEAEVKLTNSDSKESETV